MVPPLARWLAQEALEEIVHAADRLEQRGLPEIFGVAENVVVPDVGAQDLVERERAHRPAGLVRQSGRHFIAGAARRIAIGVDDGTVALDLGQVAELRQHVAECFEVGRAIGRSMSGLSRRICRAAPRYGPADRSRRGAPARCGRCRRGSNAPDWRGWRKCKAATQRRTAGNSR